MPRPQSPHLPLFVRPNAIEAVLGIPERTAHEMVKAGELPPPVQTGPRAVAWLMDELLEYRERKRVERDERLAQGLPPHNIRYVNPPKEKRPRGRPRKHSNHEEMNLAE